MSILFGPPRRPDGSHSQFCGCRKPHCKLTIITDSIPRIEFHSGSETNENHRLDRRQRHRQRHGKARMRALGARWVDADAVYRTLCAENREMLSALDTAFGGVTDPTGVLDRPKTRENRVFRPAARAAAARRNHHTVYPARRLSMRFTRRANVPSCCTMHRPCLKPVRMTFCDKIIAVLAPHDTRCPNHRAGRPDRRGRARPHRCAAERHVLPRKMRFYHRKQRRSRYAVSGHRCFIQSTH